jgi:hypothetical protein
MLNHSKDLAPLPLDPLARAAVIDCAYDVSDAAADQWRVFFGSMPSLDQRSILLDQAMWTVLDVLDVKLGSTLSELAERIDQLEAAKRAPFLPVNLLTVRSTS